MTVSASRWGWTAAPLGVAALILGLGPLGCGGPPAAPDTAEATAPGLSQPGPGASTDRAPPDPSWHQPFAEATHQDPPDGQKLPDITLAGKSVGKLYTEVVNSWDTIRFQSADGQRLAYSATLDTEFGPITIALRPDLAPNHVRNFVALSQAGYYDGLVFERTLREESTTNPGARLELVEAGCPLGLGESGLGSIGYWLKPEFHPQASHTEGTVGAWREEDPATAACRFYITLCDAPFLNGNYTVFGQVTQGLEVVRKIHQQPVLRNDQHPEADRPVRPVVIRTVTIRSEGVENGGPTPDNK
jgi:cyclophilin family peptidyl-prolyl cis-trans isomerase